MDTAGDKDTLLVLGSHSGSSNVGIVLQEYSDYSNSAFGSRKVEQGLVLLISHTQLQSNWEHTL